MFKGSIPALVTPMTNAGQLDEQSFQKLLDFHASAGTDGLVVHGTTGEACSLTTKEREKLLALTLEHHKVRDLPIMAGTGTHCTRKTIKQSKIAAAQGANACLVVTPYYNRPTQKGLLAHYQAVADAITCPIFLYNVPTRTACDLLPETVALLSEHPNIIGLKDATGNIERLVQMQQMCTSDFIFLSGDDASCYEFMRAGGHGVISVTSNVVPAWMHQMYQAIQNRQLDKAAEYNKSLQAVHKVLGLEPNPIPVKYALELMGLIEEGIRLPLTRLELANQRDLKDVLLNLGILEEAFSHA